MLTQDHLGISLEPITPHGRLRFAAISTAVAVAVAALALTFAMPASAFNPCNEDNPPPRCNPLPTPPPQPAAPTNFAVTGALTSTATLTWTDNATTEAHYAVYRWSGTLSSIPSTLGTALADLPAHPGTGTMTYVDHGVDPNGVYTYAVVAVSVLYQNSPQGFGVRQAFSSLVNFPGIPAAPTGLSLSPDPSRYEAAWNQPVIAAWTNQATNAAGIHFYGVQNDCNTPDKYQTLLATLPASATTYTLQPHPGEIWTFEARAFNPAGESAPVCFGWERWQSPPPPPVAPNVTDLTPDPCLACGPLLSWYWNGHPGDTDYDATITDKTTGQVINEGGGPPRTVNADGQTWTGGGLIQGTHVVCGHTYEVKVVTVRSGYTDSPGVTSDEASESCTGGGGGSTSGVKTLDLYNCSGEDLEIWLWSGASWVDEGDAVAVADGDYCGPGYSEPLSVSMPTGTFTLEGTTDGYQPASDNTVWGPLQVTGNSTSGGTASVQIT
jgi:hypothetical protein